jgi:hypothetical protein
MSSRLRREWMLWGRRNIGDRERNRKRERWR